jgi:hypothetical protein
LFAATLFIGGILTVFGFLVYKFTQLQLYVKQKRALKPKKYRYE